MTQPTALATAGTDTIALLAGGSSVPWLASGVGPQAAGPVGSWTDDPRDLAWGWKLSTRNIGMRC